MSNDSLEERVVCVSRRGSRLLSFISVLSMAALGVVGYQNISGADDESSEDETQKIAYVSTGGGNSKIYVMDSDGSAAVRLTNTDPQESYDFDPCWSPDATKILFTSKRDENYEIYVMNADGSGIERLTNNEAADKEPYCWSPDGTKIAFYTIRDGKVGIYVMNADGGNQRNLTNNPGADRHPSWSP